MELEFGAYTVKGIKDCGNQDHYRLLDNTVPMVQAAGRGQIFGIFDGMGSTPRAAEAAWKVGESLIDFFKAQAPIAAGQETSSFGRFKNPQVGMEGKATPLHKM